MSKFGSSNLQTVEFEGGAPAEVFAKAAAWLAPRDGVVYVQDIGWHQYQEGTPLEMILYYMQEEDHV